MSMYMLLFYNILQTSLLRDCWQLLSRCSGQEAHICADSTKTHSGADRQSRLPLWVPTPPQVGPLLSSRATPASNVAAAAATAAVTGFTLGPGPGLSHGLGMAQTARCPHMH